MDKTTLLRLLQNWDLREVLELAPLPGGINAETWKLKTASGAFVAKFAFDKTAFESGLEVAEQLELAGFSAGRPLRRRNGSLVLHSPQGTLGVLAFVPGSPLDVSHPEGMRIWGSTMAFLHRSLVRLPHVPPSIRRWPWRWIDPAADHVKSRPWLQNALTSVRSQAELVTRTRNLTLSIIHGDGAPVMVDFSTQRLSVIDWGAAMWGPLLYDVATAYWFSVIEPGLGPSLFDPFTRAYRDAAPIRNDEWQALDVFIRLRGLVQVFYFAWRCDNNIQTGLSPGDNERNLALAREKFEHLLIDR